MKVRTKAIAYGITGLVLAGVVIFSGASLGLLNVSPSGVLSVLLTDPPSVPTGVSAIYVTYSDITVHAAGFGGAGWVTVSGGGTIDTMKLVNLSQTISSGVIPSLSYDMIAINITGASVDYMGQNYSASVGAERLTIPFTGGLEVNSSNPAAALIDIQPTVLNLAASSVPHFTLAAGAKAIQVPSGEVNDSLRSVGQTSSLRGHGWFDSFQAKHSNANVSSGLTLTAESLSLSITNGGSDPMAVRLIVVTQTPPGGGMGEGDALGSVAKGAVFAVQSDGSLELLSGNPVQVESMMGGPGFTLEPGAAHQFSYSGVITTMLGGHTVASGKSYYVVVMGSEATSVQTVVAS